MDNELQKSSEQIAERVKEFKKDGLSTSLVIQLLADLSVLSARLTSADQQRSDLARKIDIVLEKQAKVLAAMSKIEDMEKEIRLNSEFRLKFMGGSVVGKLLWVLLGGAFAVLVERMWIGR